MAAFIDEGNAVKAAVAMHRALPEFRRGRPDAEALYLRIGVHAGPCYVVTANGILDYFGQTVNVAARLQGIADAGELVMAGEALDHACNQGWLESCPKPEPFRARLKGVAQELPLARVAVDVTLAK
jgi:class 3 adenylate cyclase